MTKIIRKAYQGIVPENKILDTYSDSQTDTYSCNYINRIIESGSNENGSWVKYADGTMICYKEVSFTTNVTTAWGSLYESGRLSLGNFPQEFKSMPQVAVTNANGDSYGHGLLIESVFNISNTYAGDFWVCRPLSATNVTCSFSVVAIGRWK